MSFFMTVLGASSILLFMGLNHEKNLYEKFNDQNLFSTIVVDEEIKPTFTDRDLQFATQLYGIRMNWPPYELGLDSEILDRGQTIARGWDVKRDVIIGRPAFVSWGMLGATLAHEIEVHVSQPLLAIWFLDTLGIQSSNEAERMAYEYELSNAERFGLTEHESSQIFATMEYFYPEKPAEIELVENVRNVFHSFLLL